MFGTLPLQVALKALSLKGIKDWKQLELFQREAVVLQVCVCVCHRQRCAAT
jgi:hypothetical protein